MSGTSEINHEIKLWKAKGNLHSIDLASAPAAISSALTFHSWHLLSFSKFQSERMASASSAEQVPLKIEPEELPEASGTRQGETEPGVFDLLPRSEKRPFQSPLYRKGFTMENEVDIAKELEKDIVVQVNDVQLNCWARTLVKKPDGHFYFNSPKRTRWHQNVNTWIPVDTVQRHMRDQTVPMWDGTVTALTTPRFKSIMDVATLRAAMSSLVAAIWWFNHSLRAHLVVSCALHYMSPLQTFSLQNAQPQPQWVDEALLGTRQGEETESGVPIEPRRQQ
jgi:hypothetical protein